jgi:DHA2 family multidrug resistance protein
LYNESIEDLFARYGPAYKWFATITSVIGGMTVILASSTVNVAFPDIMGAFGIGRDQAQLLSTGYFGAMTGGMLLSAWVIQNFGQRTAFIGALLIFILGSAMSGLATNTALLSFGRVFQGTAAGVVQPLAMAVTFSVWPSRSKGMSMGLFSMGMVLAPIMGPTMGGLALEYFNWHYIFLLQLPTAAVACVLGILFMPNQELPKKLPKFDFTGLLLMWTSLACLLLSFSFGQRLGWVSDTIISGFTIGIITAIGFIFRQIYGSHPLVNMKLFLVPRFSAAAVISFFAGCAFLSSTFMIPLFVQEIQHYTPLRAGILMIPGGLSLLILFPLSGRLTDLFPTSYLIYFGLFAFGMAFVLMSQADVNTPFWTFVSFTILIRVGTAFIRPVMNTEALRALPPDLVNQGSGVVNFIRMLGAAIGTNVLVVFLELRIPLHMDAFTATQITVSQASGELLGQITRLLSEAGVAEAIRTPGALNYLGEVIMAQASTRGFQDSFLALGIFAFCGFIPAIYLSQAQRKPKPTADPAE